MICGTDDIMILYVSLSHYIGLRALGGEDLMHGLVRWR